MIVSGVDLSGKPSNPSGYCLLTEIGGKKTVQVKTLYSNEDLLKQIELDNPELIAVDAPLIYSGINRRCDELLHSYGKLPVTLRGMSVLAERGNQLNKILIENGYSTIEVHSKTTAKILGVFNKDDLYYQKNLMGLDFEGIVNSRLLTTDELDAIVAALTGYLHKTENTKSIGDETGLVIIPKI